MIPDRHRYRVWDLHKKEMLHGPPFMVLDIMMGLKDFFGPRYRVMQSLGIRAGRVLIYEKDIIRLDAREIGGPLLEGEVGYNSDQTLANIGWGLWVNGWVDTDFLGKIEILGNVYEND